MKRISLCLLASAALLAGCSDETTNTTVYGASNVAEAVEEAPECTADRAGQTLYTESDEGVWICNGSNWASMKGENGKKGAKGPEGEPGEPGDKGKPGADGTGCTEIDSTDMRYSTVVCGDGTGTVLFHPTRGHFVDARDGKRYAWTLINGKIWMAENLNFGTMDSLSKKRPQKDADTVNVADKWCYHDTTEYCDVYGGSYQWHTAMAFKRRCDSTSKCDVNIGDKTVDGKWVHRGICPEGWHVPDSLEIRSLTSGNPLYKNGDQFRSVAVYSGTDVFGFSSIGGCFVENFSMNLSKSYTYMWTRTPKAADSLRAYRWDTDMKSAADKGKTIGFALRCVKDSGFEN